MVVIRKVRILKGTRLGPIAKKRLRNSWRVELGLKENATSATIVRHYNAYVGSDFTEDDIGRRNTIASLVEQWGLFRIVDYKRFEEPKTPLNKIKILPFKDKDEWTLVSKYTVGRKKK